MTGLWAFAKGWANYMSGDRGLWCSPHANKPGGCAYLHPVRYVVLQINSLGGVK